MVPIKIDNDFIKTALDKLEANGKTINDLAWDVKIERRQTLLKLHCRIIPDENFLKSLAKLTNTEEQYWIDLLYQVTNMSPTKNRKIKKHASDKKKESEIDWPFKKGFSIADNQIVNSYPLFDESGNIITYFYKKDDEWKEVNNFYLTYWLAVKKLNKSLIITVKNHYGKFEVVKEDLENYYIDALGKKPLPVNKKDVATIEVIGE